MQYFITNRRPSLALHHPPALIKQPRQNVKVGEFLAPFIAPARNLDEEFDLVLCLNAYLSWESKVGLRSRRSVLVDGGEASGSSIQGIWFSSVGLVGKGMCCSCFFGEGWAKARTNCYPHHPSQHCTFEGGFFKDWFRLGLRPNDFVCPGVFRIRVCALFPSKAHFPCFSLRLTPFVWQLVRN